MDETNVLVSLRQADPVDRDFAYEVKKVVLGEYVKKTYGRWDEAFQRRYHDRQWAPADTQIVVAEGCDVGWIWCTHHTDRISIDGIYILPHYQGRGIGTSLLTRLQEGAAEGGKSVRLWVMKINPAFDLYKRIGFSVIGEKETHWYMEATR